MKRVLTIIAGLGIVAILAATGFTSGDKAETSSKATNGQGICQSTNCQSHANGIEGCKDGSGCEGQCRGMGKGQGKGAGMHARNGGGCKGEGAKMHSQKGSCSGDCAEKTKSTGTSLKTQKTECTGDCAEKTKNETVKKQDCLGEKCDVAVVTKSQTAGTDKAEAVCDGDCNGQTCKTCPKNPANK